MGLGSLIVGDDRRKREDEKRKEAQNLFLQLMDRGASKNAAEQTASNYLKTGKIETPEYETKILPGTADVPERSTRVPTQFVKEQQKKKMLLGQDSNTGLFTDVAGKPVSSIPEDITDFEVKGYDSSPKTGENIYIRDGQIVMREPNGTRKDQIKKMDSALRGQGGSTESPDLALAKDTIKKYQTAIQKGEEISPEFQESAASAAEMLRIPMENKVLEPTMMDRFRNKASKVAPKMVSPAPERRSETASLKFNQSKDADYQRDVEAARRVVASGKLSPEEALKRLQQKYGKRINKL